MPTPSMATGQSSYGSAVPASPSVALTTGRVLSLQELREIGKEYASERIGGRFNPPEWSSRPKQAKFFVIKSYGEDDVHKSIKYGLWCSTRRGNAGLQRAWDYAESSLPPTLDVTDVDDGCPIYLFFSVNRSRCFCGMAQMMSRYDKAHSFGTWVHSDKWQGSFRVDWIYIKDIPNKDLNDIRLPNNEGKPVTYSRDTQEIPYVQGLEMLRRFVEYRPRTHILQDFEYYNSREEDLKKERVERERMAAVSAVALAAVSPDAPAKMLAAAEDSVARELSLSTADTTSRSRSSDFSAHAEPQLGFYDEYQMPRARGRGRGRGVPRGGPRGASSRGAPRGSPRGSTRGSSRGFSHVGGPGPGRGSGRASGDVRSRRGGGFREEFVPHGYERRASRGSFEMQLSNERIGRDDDAFGGRGRGRGRGHIERERRAPLPSHSVSRPRVVVEPVTATGVMDSTTLTDAKGKRVWSKKKSSEPFTKLTDETVILTGA
jgi:hypothetical protein